MEKLIVLIIVLLSVATTPLTLKPLIERAERAKAEAAKAELENAANKSPRLEEDEDFEALDDEESGTIED